MKEKERVFLCPGYLYVVEQKVDSVCFRPVMIVASLKLKSVAGELPFQAARRIRFTHKEMMRQKGKGERNEEYEDETYCL